MLTRLAWLGVVLTGASTWAADGGTNEAVMLVWGGGATPELAQASRAALDARAKALAEVVGWAPEWPRQLASASVPGLKPGFHVVVLGVCSAAEAEPLLSLLKIYEPAVYSRTVTWNGPLGCPKLAQQDDQTWTVRSSARAKVKEGSLTAVELSRGGCTGADDCSLLVLTRLDDGHGGGSVGREELDACAPDDLRAHDGVIDLETTCVHERCTSWGHADFRHRFRLEQGAVKRTDTQLRVLNRAVCD